MKLFVGRLGGLTTTQDLESHFGQYGPLADCVAMIASDGTSRHFGFVTFEDPDVAEAVLSDSHTIGGTTVEVKPADGARSTRKPCAPLEGVTADVLPATPQETPNPEAAAATILDDIDTKVFVGGLTVKTTTEMLRDYFSAYGSVADAVAMVDSIGRSRCFGFVTFDDPLAASAVLLDTHTLDGHTLDVKKVVPRPNAQVVPRRRAAPLADTVSPLPVAAPTSQMVPRLLDKPRTHSTFESLDPTKLFLGGLWNISTEDLRTYFETFGEVADVIAMRTPDDKPRGFGFVTFTDPAVAEAVLLTSHDIHGRRIDIQEFQPKGSTERERCEHTSVRPGENQYASTRSSSSVPPCVSPYPHHHERVPPTPNPPGKLFLGSLNPDTSSHDILEYFEQFGEVTDAVAMVDAATGLSRGFGFVTFLEACIAALVLTEQHVLQGRALDVKATSPRALASYNTVAAAAVALRSVCRGGAAPRATRPQLIHVPVPPPPQARSVPVQPTARLCSGPVTSPAPVVTLHSVGVSAVSTIQLDAGAPLRPQCPRGPVVPPRAVLMIRDDDPGKLFVGGLSPQTTNESIFEYFSQYGTVVDCVAMERGGKMRCFGFVTFKEPEAVQAVLSEPHTLDGHVVEVKPAAARGEAPPPKADREFATAVSGVEQQVAHLHMAQAARPAPLGPIMHKIFVGGLGDIPHDQLVAYFSAYGGIIDSVIMTDKATGKSRGFGFVTFISAECVDLVMRDHDCHQICGQWVDVKRSTPKDSKHARFPMSDSSPSNPRVPVVGAHHPAQILRGHADDARYTAHTNPRRALEFSRAGPY